MPQSINRNTCYRGMPDVHAARGLSLIEVMIALMIFSIAILAVTAMQSQGLKSTAWSRQRLCDTTAVVRQMELLMALGYDHVLLVDGDSGFNPDHPDHGPFKIFASTSTLEWEVADNVPVAGSKQIQVTARRVGSGRVMPGISFDCLKASELTALEK